MSFRLNLPPLTRGLLLTLVSLSALNATLRVHNYTVQGASPATKPIDVFQGARWAVPYLVLIPKQSQWFPWTFLTSALIENNIVSLVVSISVVWFGGRYLERAWGSTEFAKFGLFVTMIPNILTFLVYTLWYAITGLRRDFYTPINGLLALSSAFLVALKQLVPEHTVSLFRGAIRIRIKHFPAIFILANIVSGPLLGTDTAFWLALFGFYTSWIYLRFFRISEITSAGGEAGHGGELLRMKGDASDTFTFTSFFPEVVQPFLAPLCDAIWTLLVQAKICIPFSDEAVQSSNENAGMRSDLAGLSNGRAGAVGSSGGSRRAEAERRRALALKALDQRLNAAAAVKDSTTTTQDLQPSLSDPVGGSATATTVGDESAKVPV